jgi:alanyl-tRNA synthetase
VQHASQVGTITVVGEASVGSGVRRIEAYVGIEAMRYLATERALVAQLSESLKVPAQELPDRVAALVERLRGAERELDRLRAAAVLAGAGALAAAVEQIGGAQVVAAQAPAGIAGNDLRTLALDVRGRLRSAEPAVVLLASPAEAGGVSFVASVNEAGQAAGLAAGDVVRTFAPVLGARGGGKADLAQGAGGDAAKLADALAAVKGALATR